jgi:hypothetical protein
MISDAIVEPDKISELDTAVESDDFAVSEEFAESDATAGNVSSVSSSKPTNDPARIFVFMLVTSAHSW